jgi:hypothetical protein
MNAINAVQAKSIFQSLTFWGAITSLIAAMAPGVFTKLGYDAPTVAAGIVTGVGFIITIYGRLTAKQAVTLTGGPVVPPVLPPGAAPLAKAGK